MELSNKQKRAVSDARKQADNMKGIVAQEAIDAVVNKIADGANIPHDVMAIEVAKEKPVTEGANQRKENWRAEFDKYTENALYHINETKDKAVREAVDQWLEFAKSMKDAFGGKDGTGKNGRTDFRPIIILSPHPKQLDKLAVYRGGWGDGSKQDRNQYSNGRPVPVAKTTGYALKQDLPKKM